MSPHEARILVLVVVLVAGGSSDDPKLTVSNGAPAADFPLRGDLARDTGAIRAAAEVWLAEDARGEVHSRVLDDDDDGVEMRALWAGRAAAIVDHGTREQPNRGLSVFVAGGSEIDAIEVLTGRERLLRPGPVAVVPLPESDDDGRSETRARDDLAVLGRTRAGAVVVPPAVLDG